MAWLYVPDSAASQDRRNEGSARGQQLREAAK